MKFFVHQKISIERKLLETVYWPSGEILENVLAKVLSAKIPLIFEWPEKCKMIHVAPIVSTGTDTDEEKLLVTTLHLNIKYGYT